MNENGRVDRDELAEIVAEICDQLANKWWSDREAYLWSLEHDPWWEEPKHWLNESRPPVKSCGAVLAHILTEYDRGEEVEVVEVLEWAHDRYQRHTGEYRRLAHGYYRAASAIRRKTDFGWPEPDPVLGEVA